MRGKIKVWVSNAMSKSLAAAKFFFTPTAHMKRLLIVLCHIKKRVIILGLKISFPCLHDLNIKSLIFSLTKHHSDFTQFHPFN